MADQVESGQKGGGVSHGCGGGGGIGVRFPGMNSGDQREKAPANLRLRGPAPWVRRRPGYSSSGCTPAEPDSASPGTASIAPARAPGKHRENLVKRRFRRVEDWSGRPLPKPGGSSDRRGSEGSSRSGLRRIACERKQLQVFGPSLGRHG